MRLFIASSLRGDYAVNQRRAEAYCAWAAAQGHAVFAPHLLYTRFLDDTVAQQRHQGQQAGIAFLRVCEEVWVFVVAARVSDGVRAEVAAAAAAGIPVRWFAAKWNKKGDFVEVTPLPHAPSDALPSAPMLQLVDHFAAEAEIGLADIEARLRAGAAYEDCLADLDVLLGTEMPPRDRDAEAAWEGATRDGEEP